MGRAKAVAHGQKRKVSITPDPAILGWVLERTGPGKRFASVTHAAEVAWAALREHDEEAAEKKAGKK
ncbi:MAG: hypothetical protein QOE90_3510 [Thermoplasmata archaeon]|jgi:hypothetical protein|nr:hypothetical protein [Thermoplasmata archaeon]